MIQASEWNLLWRAWLPWAKPFGNADPLQRPAAAGKTRPHSPLIKRFVDSLRRYKKKKTIKSRQESKYRCPLTVCCSHEILLTKQFSVASLLAELPALVMSVQYMRSLVAFTSWLTANGEERVGLLALHRGHALQCTEASSADVDPALHFRFTKHGAEQCDGDYVCLFLASVHLLGAPGGKKWGGW